MQTYVVHWQFPNQEAHIKGCDAFAAYLESGDDWLSCKQISERVPHQEQHVRRVLRKLHAQNLLARRSRPNTNGRPTHIYGHPE